MQVVFVMTDQTSALRIIGGGRDFRAPVERIAMSLVVHDRKRLDVPLGAILGIEAFATQTFLVEGSGPVEFNMPHVRISLTPHLQAQLRDFTHDVVGEAMEIVVRDRCISRPVVREPLGNEPSFQVSVWDFAEAQRLANEMRTGWRPVRTVE